MLQQRQQWIVWILLTTLTRTPVAIVVEAYSAASWTHFGAKMQPGISASCCAIHRSMKATTSTTTFSRFGAMKINSSAGSTIRRSVKNTAIGRSEEDADNLPLSVQPTSSTSDQNVIDTLSKKIDAVGTKIDALEIKMIILNDKTNNKMDENTNKIFWVPAVTAGVAVGVASFVNVVGAMINNNRDLDTRVKAIVEQLEAGFLSTVVISAGLPVAIIVLGIGVALISVFGNNRGSVE